MLAWSSLIASKIYIGTIKEANQKLKNLIYKIRFHKSYYYARDILNQYLTSHTSISQIILFVNRELWGNVLLISLVMHVPSNVYLVYRICIYHVIGFKLLITFIIISIQIGVILGCLFPLAYSSKIIHRAAKMMNALQITINNPGYIDLKLKYLVLYERVAGKKKYGITIGPTKATTNRTIFEVGNYTWCFVGLCTKNIFNVYLFSDIPFLHFLCFNCYEIFC